MSKNVLDKFRDVLFKDVSETILSECELKQLIRYRDAFTQTLDNPWITDSQIRDYLINTYKISEVQAWRDLGNVRVLLGNVRNAGKEWIRYTVNQGLLEQYNAARKAGKYKEAIMALDKLGKYNRLDKDELEELPFDKVIPVNWEATSDVTILGVKPMANKEEEIQKLYKKYLDEIEIDDIEYQEIENE